MVIGDVQAEKRDLPKGYSNVIKAGQAATLKPSTGRKARPKLLPARNESLARNNGYARKDSSSKNASETAAKSRGMSSNRDSIDFTTKVLKVIDSDPLFCILVAVAVVLTILHITAVSGSWITYTVNL